MARNGNGHRARSAARRALVTSRHASQPVPLWLKALLALGLLGVTAMLALGAGAVAVYQSYANDLVAPDELAINKPSYGAKILDRNGKLLYEYLDDQAGLRRPVKLAEVSPAFLAATISTEDGSFFSNPGVNVTGLARAAWENSPFSGSASLFSGSGGSSITQQLVKNVYIDQEERQKRSVGRKVKEIIYAIELTQRYSKELILEWYVNQISYGGVFNGVEAAAQGYFGKNARDLTLAEAALLAGIPQSPREYDPVTNAEQSIARRNDVLDLLLEKGSIQIARDVYYEVNAEEIAAAKAEPVTIVEKRFPIEAPHFVLQYVEPQLEMLFGKEALLRDGLVVTTTIDLDMQHKAIEILEKWITEFENLSASRNGAVVVIDPPTGEILIMIGSRDYFREDILGKNNNATAPNSPGSSFKPFVYLTTFMELGWGPGTMIVDSPVKIAQPDGSFFEPANPGRNFQGPITIRNALGSSLNIPPIKAAQVVGVEKIVTQARKMGFTTLTGSYGPAIATGGVDLTPLDMTYAYSVLANGGVMKGQDAAGLHRTGERNIDPVAVLTVTDAAGRQRYDVAKQRKEERVAPEAATYLLHNVLSDPQAQCITFGCGGITVPGRPAGVKTGTSEPYDPKGPRAGKIGETWAFGFTPDYAVGIWAGNSDNSPVDHIYSTSISFRAMRDVMLAAYDGRPSTQIRRPVDVVEATVCVPSGLKPTSLCGKTTKDLFMKDKVPTVDDNWWRNVSLDLRNGLLAGPGTPPQFVRAQVMLVPPDDLVKTEEDRKRMQEWADALGVPLAPTETSTSGGGTSSELPAAIYSPLAGANVIGQVHVLGRATSGSFQNFRLEYGSGTAPTSWTLITQSNNRVENGTLASWDTAGLPPGVYTLRLVVMDQARGAISASVTVNLGLPTPTPTRRP